MSESGTETMTPGAHVHAFQDIWNKMNHNKHNAVDTPAAASDSNTPDVAHEAEGGCMYNPETIT